ncbi:MAG TPA: redox-sensing transcriptional repressor Rex [Lachnospiraceae bacterium]|jgi:redox-sensing transcriptional repressor|nr:redox-sensing transcriptional repressor Rex [Lachnospiraceae bacterium]
MDNKGISKAVINRLPRYYRYLGMLLDKGVVRISSADLSSQMNVTASQIRQDLNLFGGFGQQGYGYNVAHLYEEIGKILGLDRAYHLIVIGAGRLARAVGSYVGFQKRGFRVEAFFDRNPAKHLDEGDDSIPIYPLEELSSYLENNKIDIGVIAVPAEAARKVVPVLDAGGVRGIWNFAHTDLDVPPYMTVQSVHLSESLMQLSYKINHSMIPS